MELNETKIDGKTVYDGKIMRVERDRVELGNGKTAYREVVRHNGGACIAALTEDDEILLVRQFRYPFASPLLEIPAGKLEKGEQPENCARRELKEETGYDADVEFLTEIYPTPGYSDEIIYIYSAKADTIGKLDLDEDEFLDVEKIKFCDALKMVENGEIKDAKTIIAVLTLNAKRNNCRNNG